MHDVRALAHHERAVVRHERRIGAARVDVRAVTRQPRLLDARAQRQPALELHHDLRLPRDGACGRVIHVEIVLILARLDVELEVAVLPPRPAAARPDPQGAVLEEILVAFRGEAQVGFGTLAEAQAAAEQPQRALVDFGGADLEARVTASRLVRHAGWGRVPEIAVLRADDGCNDLPDSGAALATDPGQRRVGALHP